ncbi:MAG: sugar ABC transporter ATP-binding protein, partial [Thermoprotei archaeon]
LKDIGIKRHDPEMIVGKMSGGERQSIAIARAVYFGAKLVILDEPTSALSIKESEKVLQYVIDLKRRGISSIIISHNIYHVYSVADRIVVLDRGRKVLDIPKELASPEEIIDVIAHRMPPEKLQSRAKT